MEGGVWNEEIRYFHNVDQEFRMSYKKLISLDFVLGFYYKTLLCKLSEKVNLEENLMKT